MTQNIRTPNFSKKNKKKSVKSNQCLPIEDTKIHQKSSSLSPVKSNSQNDENQSNTKIIIEGEVLKKQPLEKLTILESKPSHSFSRKNQVSPVKFKVTCLSRKSLTDSKNMIEFVNSSSPTISKVIKPSTKELFVSIFKTNCTEFNIPLSFSILENISLFYDQFLIKLSYLNEQMMEIYSRVLCYRSSSGLSKNNFLKKIKKNSFEIALKEVDEWLSNQENKKVPILSEQVCNLYSINFNLEI